MLVPVVAIAALLGVFLVQSGVGQPEYGQAVPLEATSHAPPGTPLEWRNDPPSSGPHYTSTATYGLATTPIEPGYWVHSLEHGAIVILYDCAAAGGDAPCQELRSRLESEVFSKARRARGDRVRLVGTPYEGLGVPVAAVAWGRVLRQTSLDPAQLLAFYDRYVDRGPEDLP